MHEQQHILIIGPSWVGDMVMAQSLFKLLKAQNPETIIDVLAPGWALPLIDRMPEVNLGIEMPVGHGQLQLQKRWQIGKTLRNRYSQAIILPNSLKSALIPFFARIKKRTGWLGEARYGLLNDYRRLNKRHLTMTVQRFAALAYASTPTGIPEIIAPRLEVKVSNVQLAMKKHHLVKAARDRVLALCPGAEYGNAKRWPVAHYAALANNYLSESWNVWLFGSEKDQPVCQEINQLCGQNCVDLSGRTTLAEAVDLMSVTDAVVSNDSGLMHVAAALDRPLVAIYGSSDPAFTPPLNKTHRIVSRYLKCSPCFQRECPLGHMDCLNKLDVQTVQKALQEMLG